MDVRQMVDSSKGRELCQGYASKWRETEVTTQWSSFPLAMSALCGPEDLLLSTMAPSLLV